MPVVHFDERDDAEAFVTALGAREIGCVLVREEFAGEEDAEDAAWLVEVDPQPTDLANLIGEHGGWLVTDRPGAQMTTPPLPDGPKRFKR